MEKQLVDITWDKGANYSTPASMLADGEAAALTNWYPDRGGLRARRGWVNGSTTTTVAFPSTRNGRGIAVLAPNNVKQVFVALAGDAAVDEVQQFAVSDWATGDSFTLTWQGPGWGAGETTSSITYDTHGTDNTTMKNAIESALGALASWSLFGVAEVSITAGTLPAATWTFTITFKDEYGGQNVNQATSTDTACTVTDSTLTAGVASGRYQIYRQARGTIAGTWTPLYSTGTTWWSPTSTVGPIKFAPLAGTTAGGVVIAPSTLAPRYTTSATITAALGATGAAASTAVAFYNNRNFYGVSSKLYCSDLGLYTGASGTNYVGVNEGDGDTIEDLEPYLDFLAVGKGTGVWLLSGSGLDSFELQPLDTGYCARGKSLVASPEGLFIIGDRDIYFYQADVKRISEPLEGTYAVPDTGFVYGAWWDDKLHVSVSDGTYYVYDSANESWVKEAAATAADGAGPIVASQEYLYTASKAATVNSIAQYRKTSTITPARDAGIGEAFAATTGLIFLGDGNSDVTTRELYIRLRQYGTESSPAPLKVVVKDEEGVEIQSDFAELPNSTPTIRRFRLDFGAEASAFQLAFTHTMTSSKTVLFDIERIQAVVEVTERR